MIQTERYEQLEITHTDQLRSWLEKHHQQSKSIWLVTFKKHINDKYVDRFDVLDELICYGWIDGIRRKVDDDKTMQLISPRKAQHWVKTYKDRAARLEREGRMTDAGRRCIAISKQNGLWHFMDDVDALIKPEDLVLALNQHKGAMSNFDNFGDASKRFVLRWIKLAKTPKTRAKRTEQTASLAAQNKKVPGS